MPSDTMRDGVSTVEPVLSQLLNRIDTPYTSHLAYPWRDLDNEPFGTPLHISVFKGHIDAIRILIANGADVNAVDAEKGTPLTIAAKRGFVEISAILIKAGSRVNHRDFENYTPLMHAATYGFLRVVELLHQNGADLSATEDVGQNALHLAAGDKGNAQVFAYLAFHGVPVKRDVFGYTPVQTALRTYRLRSFVFSSGMVHADLESLGHILSFAAEKDDSAFVRRFCRALPASDLERFTNRATTCWQTPLCQAAGTNSVASAKVLIEYGAKIDLEGCVEGTPLMLACAYGRLDMVKLLVRSGARLEYTNDKGEYKNAFVFSRAHPQVTKWLLLGRFQEQRRLQSEVGPNLADVKPWSGTRSFEFCPSRLDWRRWGESTFELLCRRHWAKEHLRGKVVPSYHRQQHS